MNKVDSILGTFEKELLSIISAKQKTLKKIRKKEQSYFKKHGSKEPEQIKLHKLSIQQKQKYLKAEITLKINSDALAGEVHRRIKRLIKKKKYPIQEVHWYQLIRDHKWHFGFKY